MQREAAQITLDTLISNNNQRIKAHQEGLSLESEEWIEELQMP